MSLPDNLSTRKQVKIRLRPNRESGLYIKFVLALRKHGFVDIARSVGVTPQSVACVVFGARRSARVEGEIARILEKHSWNDVVTEAHLATSGTSVSIHPSSRSKRRIAV